MKKTLYNILIFPVILSAGAAAVWESRFGIGWPGIMLCSALFLLSLIMMKSVFFAAAWQIRYLRLSEEFFASFGAVFALFGAVFSFASSASGKNPGNGLELLIIPAALNIYAVKLLTTKKHDALTLKKNPEAFNCVLPKTARVLVGGFEKDLPTSEISPGDILSLSPNDRIPCDGEILAGRSDIDESCLSGALFPVLKSERDRVMAGTVNLSGFLTVKASEGKSELEKNREAYEASENARAVGKTERVSSIFGTAVFLVLTLITAVLIFTSAGVKYVFAAGLALMSLLPCGLMIVRVSRDRGCKKRMKKNGVELSDSAALEPLSETATVIFSHTGAATVGRLSVLKTMPVNGQTERTLIRLAAAVLKCFDTPLTEAVVSRCEGFDIAVPPVIAPERMPGRFMGTVDGKSVTVSMLREDVISMGGDSEDKADIAVFSSDEPIGAIILGDKLKQSAPAAVTGFKLKGIKTVLAADDAAFAADNAYLSGVQEYKTGLDGSEKAKYVESLSKKGKSVIFVADGISDIAAAAHSDCSFAMSSSREEVKSAASAVLLRNDLRDIIPAIETAQEGIKAEKSAATMGIWARAAGGLGAVITGVLGYSLTAAGIAAGGILVSWLVSGVRAGK